MRDLTAYSSALAERGVDAQRAADICHRAWQEFGHLVNDWELDKSCNYLQRAVDLDLSRLDSAPRDVAARESIVDEGFDFLGRDPTRTSFSKALSLVVAKVAPKKRVAVVATVRNEGPYLLEWISHNIAIGVEHFFIYTNDNSDGSEELLRALSVAGIVTLFHNKVGKDINPQIKAYDHLLHFVPRAREYQWLFFLDADEFFLPQIPFETLLDDALSSDRRIASLSFNWLWMGSSGLVEADLDRFLTERFIECHIQSLFVKSVVRPNEVFSMMTVHKPMLAAGVIGTDGALAQIDMQNHDSPYSVAGGIIRHYWNKSFEEFLAKQSRGKDRSVWERGTELFFDWDAPRDSIKSPFPTEATNALRRIYQILLSSNQIAAAERKVRSNYSQYMAVIKSGRATRDIFRDAERYRRIIRFLPKDIRSGGRSRAANLRIVAPDLVPAV